MIDLYDLLKVGIDRTDYRSFHSSLRKRTWLLSRVFYFARGYGPKHVEDTTFVVGIEHESRLDSLAFSYIEDYLSMVFSVKDTFLTKAGRDTNGISVKETPNGARIDIKRFMEAIKNKESIGTFTQEDIGGDRRIGVLELAMRIEEKFEYTFRYRSLRTVYRHIFSKPLYFRGTKVPLPFTISMKIFVSDDVLSDGKTPNELFELLKRKGYDAEEKVRRGLHS